MKFTKCLMLLLSMAMCASAFADNPTYKVCDEAPGTNSWGEQFINCSFISLNQGMKTIQLEMEDPNSPGSRILKSVVAANIVSCNADGACGIVQSSVYRQGTVMGTSPQGVYQINQNHYIDRDVNGRATQYRIGTGPRFAGGQRAGDVSSPAPAQQVVVVEASCAPQMDDECTINNKKVPRAQLGNYLPVVNVEAVELSGGSCEYPICYDTKYKPVGIRE